MGGQPRYDINNNPRFSGNNQMTFSMNVNKLRQETQNLANKHKPLIENYIKHNS